jgi:hypothetical protein
MRLTICLGAVAMALVAAPVPADPPRHREGALKVGDPAPRLALADLRGQSTVHLVDLRGKPVVLIFGSCT